MRKLINFLLEKKKNISNALFFSVLLAIGIGIYIYFNSFYVIVRFDELGAVSKNMAAYYNGFKVGKITKIEPDNDFKHTLATLTLDTKNLNLPRNTTVQVKNLPTGEMYLELVYPQAPSLIKMKRGEKLEGIAPYSLEEFMLGQNISGMSDIVSIHIIKALDAMGVANMEMESFFRNTSGILVGNRSEIDASFDNMASMTKSLAATAENLNQASQKLNQSIDAQGVRTSTSNIKDSTQNIKETTENINRATKDLDKTMQKLDSTMSHINSAASNADNITSGVNQTLSKRFGGMRMLLGKPIPSNAAPTCP